MSPRSSSASRRSASSTSSRTPMFPAASTRSGTRTLELLNAGIHVMTAVNIQHLETLNDAVARATGVRVRETVPDTFLHRADEVINVDVTVEELRNRLREGKIYQPEKVEQALSNFFRKGNLSTLRELALRAVADEVSEKAASYRAREGLEPALIPERVMVCMSSNTLAPRAEDGSADRGPARREMVRGVRGDPAGEAGSHQPRDADALQQNIRLAESLGATVVRVKAERPSDGLVAFAQREGVTHVIFGQVHGRAGSAPPRFDTGPLPGARCPTPPSRSCRSATGEDHLNRRRHSSRVCPQMSTGSCSNGGGNFPGPSRFDPSFCATRCDAVLPGVIEWITFVHPSVSKAQLIETIAASPA